MEELELVGDIRIGERVILKDVFFHIKLSGGGQEGLGRWSGRFEVLDEDSDMAFDDALVSRKPLTLVLQDGKSGRFTRTKQDGRMVYIQGSTPSI